MKRRNIIICVLMLVLVALFAGACAGPKNAEELAIENGATVKVTLDLAGGVSDEQGVRYLRIKEGSPIVLPWEHTAVISSPYYEGYRLEGFYTGEKDEAGNITYKAKWDFRTKIYEDMTLYARWVRYFRFRIIDAVSGNVLKENSVNAGDVFDVSERNAAKVDGYTFIEYYQDKDMTKKWDPDFKHPGYPEGVTDETATEEDFVYTVYAHYVEGEYKKVYTASDFTVAANYWLIGDENGVIDFTGKTNWPVRTQFVGKIVGNGVTIKNLTFTRKDVSQTELGLFGRLSGAEITDVTFENCTMEIVYTRRPQGVTSVTVGFLGGTAENTTLKNVVFKNCAVNLSVGINSATGNPYVATEYEEAEEGTTPMLAVWARRSADEANGNRFENVSGDIAVNDSANNDN